MKGKNRVSEESLLSISFLLKLLSFEGSFTRPFFRKYILLTDFGRLKMLPSIKAYKSWPKRGHSSNSWCLKYVNLTLPTINCKSKILERQFKRRYQLDPTSPSKTSFERNPNPTAKTRKPQKIRFEDNLMKFNQRNPKNHSRKAQSEAGLSIFWFLKNSFSR